MFRLAAGSVIVSGLGEIAIGARAATPAAVSVTDAGVTFSPLLPATVRVLENNVAVGGVNTTLTVHEAPTASVVLHEPAPPWVAVARANGCGVTPPNVKVRPDSAELPVLVSVRVCRELVVPFAQLPKASGFELTVAVKVGATPVPVSVTDAGVTPSPLSPATVRVLESDAAVVGANTTFTVHEAPTASVVPHEPAPPCVAVARANGCGAPAPNVKLRPDSAELPVFVSVSDCAAPVAPVIVSGKASGFAATVARYVGARPVPPKATGVGVTLPPATLTDVEAAPTAVGLNVTLIVHEAPGANGDVQVVVDPNGEEAEIDANVKLALPLFLSVTV